MICSLCKSSEQDNVLYGEFLQKGKVSVHYYCLLLTTVMEQNGNDNEGIRGFLLPDILDCVPKNANKKCTYCRQTGANIACCNMKCFRFFHTVCGAKNNARYTFHDTFQSFCHRHIDLPVDAEPHDSEETCTICCNNMGQYHPLNSIRTPCCSSGWFHRICLGQCALSAGYFFRCPLCNDDETFRKFLINRNVFIPDRDASWELAPQAFSELERTISCSAEYCACPRGRNMDSGHWKMKICGVCGSSGIHKNCNKIFHRRKFTCKDCEQMLTKIDKQKIAEPPSDYGDPPVLVIEDSLSDISERREMDEIIEILDSPAKDFTQGRCLRSRTKSCLEPTMVAVQDNINKTEETELKPESNYPKRTLRSRTMSLFQSPGSSTSTATLNSLCGDDQVPETSFGSADGGTRVDSRKKTNSEKDGFAEVPKVTLRKRTRSLYVRTPSDDEDNIPLSLLILDKKDVNRDKTPSSKRKKTKESKDVMKMDIFTEPRRRSLRLLEKDARNVSQKKPEIDFMQTYLPIINNRKRPFRKAAICSLLTTFKMTKLLDNIN